MNDISKCYEILGLDSNASKEQITQTYQDLLKVWNPDMFSNDPDLQKKAHEKRREIDNSYEKIMLSLLRQASEMESEVPRPATAVDIGTQRPLESSRPSLKGDQKPRPWVRFWARTLDLSIFLVLSSLLIGFLYGFLYTLINNEAPSLSGLVLVSILLGTPIAFVIDAISMTLFGNTPGKAILRTYVTNADGSKLSLRNALLRNMRVYFSGYGLGIPLVQFVTFIVAYKKLTNQGKTSWDEKHNFIVSHDRIGGGRVLIYCVVFFIYLVGAALLNNISQNEMKKWVNASNSYNIVEEAPIKGKSSFVDPFAPIDKLAAPARELKMKELKKEIERLQKELSKEKGI